MRSLQLTRALGSGSFGTVYRAELLGGQGVRRTVAVKVLGRDNAGRDMFLSRIRDEARLLGLLEDDHILKVLELLRVDNRDAVMMEFVDGVDLAAMVELNQLAPPRALAALGAVVAGALYKAHTARHPSTGEPLYVVHRDVKPANVMLTPRGGVKLLDFGIAKAAFESRESFTGQLVLGTLNYMAPEYLLTGKLSPAVDVYGLALMLVEVATGLQFGKPKLRVERYEASREEYLAQLPPEHGPLVPLLREMMGWDPEQRPHSGIVEQQLLHFADELRGTGLRRWCAQAVPLAQRALPPVRDGEGLQGRTVVIQQGEALSALGGVDATSPVLEPTAAVQSLGGAHTARSDSGPVRQGFEPKPRASSSRKPAASTKGGTRKGPSTRMMMLQGLLLGSVVGGIGVMLMLILLAYFQWAR